mmetsp:Transcript_33657/g.70387  ORF Transcript_33657/g.70387 Transcript_33657/m.70387 type:complete len:101 (+) Transcript_33657:718-1020(+)
MTTIEKTQNTRNSFVYRSARRYTDIVALLRQGKRVRRIATSSTDNLPAAGCMISRNHAKESPPMCLGWNGMGWDGIVLPRCAVNPSSCISQFLVNSLCGT